MVLATRLWVLVIGAAAVSAVAGTSGAHAADCTGDVSVDDPEACEAEDMVPVRLLQSGLSLARAAQEPGHAGRELDANWTTHTNGSELTPWWQHTTNWTMQALSHMQTFSHTLYARIGSARLAEKPAAWRRRQVRKQRRALARRGLVAKARPAASEPAVLAEVLTDATTTTENALGLSLNSAGDLSDFLETSAMYVILIGVMFVGFSVARRRYPLVYSKNVFQGFALGSLPAPSDYFTGWVSSALHTNLEDVADNVGLDRAMLLRFSDLGMSMAATIGVPMILICGLCNLTFGGNAAGDDHMSYLSFGNVEYGSWLYYPYSLVVWMVVVFVHKKICWVQADFLKLRFKWLREMDRVRANTVLVDGIPDEYQRDDLFHDYFERMFPGQSVKDAHCVKDSGELLVLWDRRAKLRVLLREAEAKWELTGKKPEERPHHSDSLIGVQMLGGTKVDSIDAYQKELDEIGGKIKDAREKLQEESKTVAGVNLSVGFVTFTERQYAEIALAVNVGEDKSVWVIQNPPSPADILWKDLKQDPNARAGREFVGFLCVVGLYCAYLPLVIAITNVADLIDMGPLDSLWSTVAPTAGLQIMVAFLPTFLRIIFENFFTLKASAWGQHKIQTWYFWFNVVFVVMIAAVGTDFFTFAETLAESPFEVFDLLGDTLPYATHYYCNYVVLQWFTHFMNLTRYVQYFKFKAFSAIYSDEEAATMCEPEDQDYYGIGSRSARFTTILVIGIVYGTLCPPLNLLVYINFFVCRLVYGYTMTFAETKKSDLGGVFWATQLTHLYTGLIIYTVCMTGVFYCRVTAGDETAVTAPVIVSALAIPYVIWARHKFEDSFNWERLPFNEVFQGLDEGAKKRQIGGHYMQPECLPNEDMEAADVFDMQSNQAALRAAVAGTSAAAAPGQLFSGLTGSVGR